MLGAIAGDIIGSVYEARPINSWGNGSAMRVSPVGFACDNLDDVLSQAKRSAEVTHDHPEGIKGAQAVASAVFLARTGQSKEQIKNYVERAFGYISTKRWMRSARGTSFRSRARSRCRRRFGRSWSRTASRMPCGRRSLWVGTATRWPAWRAGSPRHSTGEYPR